MKKDKKSLLNKAVDQAVSFVCGSVGGKMALNASKILIPNGTLLTKLGAYLIGSGIGEIAAKPTIATIDDGFVEIEKLKVNKTEEPKTENTESEETVETE